MRSIKTRITEMLKIRYPIIQGGMLWVSGARLVSSVSNAGGLGILGAGSMRPDKLRKEIAYTRALTRNPFGVNIPVSFKYAEEHIQIAIESKVPVVITSAGSPKKYTSSLQSAGCRVFHVVPTARLAKKCEEAGVDAVVAEGTEAGGHNGYEEITTIVLVPAVRETVKIPVIAAGGIMDGKTMLAALALGADAVQIGTIFAVSVESDAHMAYKHSVVNANEGDSLLLLKKVIPTRMIKNPIALKIKQAEEEGRSREELENLLGKNRAMKGISLGDIDEGILEAGQVCARIKEIKPAAEIVNNIWTEFFNELERMNRLIL